MRLMVLTRGKRRSGYRAVTMASAAWHGTSRSLAREGRSWDGSRSGGRGEADVGIRREV